MSTQDHDLATTAATLRRQAAQIAAAAIAVEQTVDGLAFSGPAADRLRESAAERRVRVLSIAGDLEEAATALTLLAARSVADGAGG